MPTLSENITKKILAMGFSDITEKNTFDKNIVFNTISENTTVTIEANSILEMVNEDNETNNLYKNEVIIIYPLDEYTMYETLITLKNEQNGNWEIIDVSYSLILVTPDNRKIDCDFFDTTNITGNNKIIDNKYKNDILDIAKTKFS